MPQDCIFVGMSNYLVVDSHSIFSDRKSVGDIIEREIGVFFVVSERTLRGDLLTEQLLIIPEPSQCINEAEWTSEVDNMLLDLILTATDETEKKRYVDLMSYVKDNYGYKEFEKELESIR